MPMKLKDEELAGIKKLRLRKVKTRRANAPALEKILYKAIPILNHGFIRVVDYMGNDDAIVQAARVSYGSGTRRPSDDRTLIRYLMRHSHTTPFEMAEIKLHVRLPIFVARQWIRHRTANVNEYSARYSILDREFYIPNSKHIAVQAKNNRQGRENALDSKEVSTIIELLQSDAQRSYEHYLWMLNEQGDSSRKGIARELARINLPLSTYTQWYWKTDLHNLMHFVELRADPHAQFEIRVYAEEILKILLRWVPISAEAFLEYRMNATKLSSTATKAISFMLQGKDPSNELAKLSSRERAELLEVFQLTSNKT
jgi:thymidylate synthase (FAD)